MHPTFSADGVAGRRQPDCSDSQVPELGDPGQQLLVPGPWLASPCALPVEALKHDLVAASKRSRSLLIQNYCSQLLSVFESYIVSG